MRDPVIRTCTVRPEAVRRLMLQLLLRELADFCPALQVETRYQ